MSALLEGCLCNIHKEIRAYRTVLHVHVQYVCWAELLYIQLLTPRASFVGHLGGILAGLLHVNVLERLTLSGRSRALPFRSGILQHSVHELQSQLRCHMGCG